MFDLKIIMDLEKTERYIKLGQIKCTLGTEPSPSRKHEAFRYKH